MLDSKTRIPEMAHSLVDRAVLLAWIKEHGLGNRIVVFHASAGFGKTVFMAEMARECQDCVWYQVDTLDNDPAYFLQGLNYGLSRLLNDEDEELTDRQGSELTQENLEEAVFLLARRMAEASQKQLFLMLDDFHKITEEQVFYVIRGLLDYTPANVRICMTVKGQFPRFLASYILKGEVLHIKGEQLRFSQEEAGKLVSGLVGQEVPDQTIKSILEYTEGWPAGVMFAGLVLKNDGAQTDVSSILLQSRVFDYIYYEIFRKLPFDIQNFLVETSALQAVNPALCDWVTEKSGSGGNLDYLAAENLFIYKFTGRKKWYRYHSIFRDFLESRLSEERKTKIWCRAAEYFLRIGEIEQAMYYSMLGKAYDVAEIVMERESARFLQEGKTSTVKQWVQFLEPEKERMGEACLYRMGQYYRSANDLEKEAWYLGAATRKVYEAGALDRYGNYGVEYVRCLCSFQGLARGEEEACAIEGHMKDKTSNSYFRLLTLILELKLQIGDRAGLEQFFARTTGSKRKMHLTMARNAVAWILGMLDKESGWGNTLEEARMYQRFSPVFAEYGFFKYIWYLYQKGDRAYVPLLKDGMSLGGNSIFARHMEVLSLLREYEASASHRKEIKDGLERVESELKHHGMELPTLREEDASLLFQILNGKENPQMIRVYCLGRFVAESDGQPLTWRTKKPRSC
ncbi:MAG: hypothetical protein ACLTKI_09445, partial [Lachnospiraceae bacterium]